MIGSGNGFGGKANKVLQDSCQKEDADSSSSSSYVKRHKPCVSSYQYQYPYPYPGKENIPPQGLPISCGSIESRLLLFNNNSNCNKSSGAAFTVQEAQEQDNPQNDFEPNTQFRDLFNRLGDDGYEYNQHSCCDPQPEPEPEPPLAVLACPLCGLDLSEWDQVSRQSHANACLDDDGDDNGNTDNNNNITELLLQPLPSNENVVDDKKKQQPPLNRNRLITDFFSSPSAAAPKQKQTVKAQSDSRTQKQTRIPAPVNKNSIPKSNSAGVRKTKDIPSWCSIPGTPFRVDAFRYLRRDCSHWFLTHFHLDHYQGLTRSFSYGKIYCSMITAKLLNVKIGIPWDRIQVMPLNQKITVTGVGVTCYDANHCPGSIIILFEPPNGKAVLHTGDFRFNDELAQRVAPMATNIYTLILDTTYCDPQYNFPKQEAVVQFVIEAIQAESFNPKTLFLIGSYTIGKERLFLEVARVLRKKIFVTAAKFRLLECLELPPEDLQWITLNEHESHIHVVPMWTIASFKRLKQLSYQYAERFSLIVAFSPTGWTFDKGRKSAGRRRQQGTIIRYEVPYSEHCSFEELKEFVKLLSPTEIIPSVNNDGEASTNAMLALLLS